jgi:hypothetical protein
MGYETNRIGLRFDAEPVAKGIVRIMEQNDPDSITLLRFGMINKTWIDHASAACEAVVRDRFVMLPTAMECTTIINAASDDCEVVHFKLDDVVAEMVHEISVALYGCVEMVV